MAQGWDIDSAADTITFYEAPANGAAIVVNEYAQASYNATDIWAFGAWSDEFGYPKEIEFFADRLIFAGTETDPQTLWFSQVGDYTNFGKSTPTIDSDAILATINSRKINPINDLVALDSLLINTANTEWRLDTGNTGIIASDTIGFKPQSYNGSGTVPAVVIDNTGLYIQKRGQSVRELSSDDSYTGKYGGRDITAFSSHLFAGHDIIEWAYQQYPFSVVWAVRDDGILLCLTYMKEHDVIGWTRCETDGIVESICVIPEGEEDSVYIVVKRTIPGLSPTTRRYVERLSSRLIDDVRDGRFLDSYLTFDGRVTASPINPESGPYVVGNSYNLNSGGLFASTDVNDYVVINYDSGANGGVGVRFKIIAYIDANNVTGLLENPGDTLTSGTYSDWGFARDQVAIPAHLKGKTVGIFGDGATYDDQVVPSSGFMTIDPPAVVTVIGLKYTSDMETLEINAPGAETLYTKNKLIKEVGVILQESRSVRIGPDFDHLDEVDAKQTTSYGLPDILDGTYQIPIRSTWAERGRVCIRQSDPLPISVLGVVTDLVVGK